VSEAFEHAIEQRAAQVRAIEITEHDGDGDVPEVGAEGHRLARLVAQRELHRKRTADPLLELEVGRHHAGGRAAAEKDRDEENRAHHRGPSRSVRSLAAASPPARRSIATSIGIRAKPASRSAQP